MAPLARSASRTRFLLESFAKESFEAVPALALRVCALALRVCALTFGFIEGR